VCYCPDNSGNGTGIYAMNSSEDEFFITSCMGCGKKYRLAKGFLGKQVKCKSCQTVWKVSASVNQAASLTDVSELTGSGLNSGPSPTTPAPSSASNISNSSLNESTIDEDLSWVGRKLGRFQIVEVLGKGAMGIVFRAHDPDLKRDVALKILARKFIRSQKKTYRLEQFIREARSAARLSHPYTVTVFEIGQDQGWFFIAMELVEGKTLLDLVRKKKKRVPLELICQIIAQAAEALSAAHKLGIIHRDIKPSNLMLTKDGRVKVADFGLAQLADSEDDFELPTKAVGTPYWMSPEQCQGKTAVPQSDIYSLGAVLFFTLTGEVPYRGKNKREILSQHLSTPISDPRAFRKDIPESLVRIIQKAMAKNPSERYQDAAEMAIGLRQIAQALTQSKMAERWWGQLASTGSIPNRQTGKSGLTSLRNSLLIIVILAILGGGFYWYSKHNSPSTLPPKVQSTDVPVFVIKGTQLYHALGCSVLKDVPKDQIVKFPSDKAAEDQGKAGCRYCEDILRVLKAKASTQTPRPPLKIK